MCDTFMYTQISGYVQFIVSAQKQHPAVHYIQKKLDIWDFRTVLEQLRPKNTDTVKSDEIKNDHLTVWATKSWECSQASFAWMFNFVILFAIKTIRFVEA